VENNRDEVLIKASFQNSFSKMETLSIIKNPEIINLIKHFSSFVSHEELTITQ
jgi:hypothetical protein